MTLRRGAWAVLAFCLAAIVGVVAEEILWGLISGALASALLLLWTSELGRAVLPSVAWEPATAVRGAAVRYVPPKGTRKRRLRAEALELAQEMFEHARTHPPATHKMHRIPSDATEEVRQQLWNEQNAGTH